MEASEAEAAVSAAGRMEADLEVRITMVLITEVRIITVLSLEDGDVR